MIFVAPSPLISLAGTRWAFVDFTSVEYSTVVLTNPRIHHLNGRKLVVEYASPEAVRRGGGGARADKDRPSAKQHSRVNEASTKRKSHPNEGEGDEVREGDITVMEKKRRTGREGHGDPQESRNKGFVVKHPGKRARTKPGAALAQAKRETAAIVPSQGQKIVF